MSVSRSPAVATAGELYTTDELLKLLDRSQTDSVFHLKEVQGVELVEDYQERLLRAIEIHERVAVRSCHDMGKTWTMARAAIWFFTTHPGCKVITTAPTARQVKLLLWNEIRSGVLKSKYPLGGELGVQEWKIDPDWFAVGFTTQKQAAQGESQANSGFQGIHGEWVFVIFDEATGIPPDVWKQLEGLLTSANVRFVAIGNPTTKASEFYKCFSDSSYKKLHLSCFDSPNLKANGIHDLQDLEEELDRLKEMDEEQRLEALASYKVVRPKLLTTRWVMAMALKWGLTHPLFVSKVLGEFPDEDESCLMPLGLIELAGRRTRPKPRARDRLFIGVDVARKGGDKSVIIHLREHVMVSVKVGVKRVTTEVTGMVIKVVNDLPEAQRLAGGVITVDATGIGSGVCDQLREYQSKHIEWRNIVIQEFHCGETWKEGRDGSKASIKKRAERYVNKKAEAFYHLAEDLKEELVLLPDDIFLEELPTIQYGFDSKGRWKIVDKEQYKKLTGRSSPDHADSLSLANYGRHYAGATAGKFTKEMAEAKGRPMAGSLKGDD